jgi:O-succinylbenzoic acid--CoA ligase
MQHAHLAENPRGAIAAVLSGDVPGLIVQTSGSAGAPREVLIGPDALLASARATTSRLGGPGAWLLAIPASRIGGGLVIARATIDRTPIGVIPGGQFTVEAFAAAAAELAKAHGARRYTSLVPTQVVRLAASDEGRAALATFDAVLVGGAALPELGVDANLISTYGATETCGGCVYDGVPLEGVEVATAADGRVRVAGATLADGYADGDDSLFITHDGKRWFLTPDAGTWDGQRLTVAGRVDDVIITGGLKAHPARVESALEALHYVAEAGVAGTPDPEWGEKVTAWVVPAQASGTLPDVSEVRAALAARLESHELPRQLNVIAQLPRTPGGKIDRRALRALARGEE